MYVMQQNITKQLHPLIAIASYRIISVKKKSMLEGQPIKPIIDQLGSHYYVTGYCRSYFAERKR